MLTRHAIAALLATLVAAPALADIGEHVVILSPRYSLLMHTVPAEDEDEEPVTSDLHGGGLGIGYEYGLDEFWALMGEGSYGAHAGEGGVAHAGLVLAGARYNIDAVEWVPHVHLLAGASMIDVPSAELSTDLVLGAGFGVNYRRWRSFAIGVDGRYLAPVTSIETLPGIVTASVKLLLYFD